VAARVARRQRALGFKTVREYVRFLERDASGEELVHFLDSISTNFTSFFREPDHFELLSRAVKQWVGAGQKHFRFWSAAASSGEEPYSMAITIAEALGVQDADFLILATDISTRVLSKACEGVYEEEKLASLSTAQRARHFMRDDGGRKTGKGYRVRPEIKGKIVFKRLNLAKPPFPMTGPLDMVFCRNVMIYFDAAVREGLIKEIERLLKPDGFLVIGHSETLAGIGTGLRVIRPSVYQKGAGV